MLRLNHRHAPTSAVKGETTMVCIKVFGVPTEEEAVKVKHWLVEVVKIFVGKRYEVETIVIVIPTSLSTTTLCGDQVVEITYTRPYQQRIRSGLAPYLVSNLGEHRPPITTHWEPVIVLIPAGEVITYQSTHA